MTTPHILLVDDDPGVLRLLSMRLEAYGFRTTSVRDGSAALDALQEHALDVVITDLRMADMDGLTLFEKIHTQWPSLPVIILTAHGSIPEAVHATQRGVFAFLTKPVDKEELRSTLEQALRIATPAVPDGRDFDGDITTCSSKMYQLLDQAQLAARSDVNILITGESGTGKELLAQAIQRGSNRWDKPFITLNCSAIPHELLESELFGHVKGSFTGANQNHDGLFLAADGGTIFLDEIGDMPPALQVKLLRVIQEQKIRPVGGTSDREIDVRIVSATHRDLLEAIEGKQFREDLYYRLNVVNLALPPLRERREDIPLLVSHFLESIAARNGSAARHLSNDALLLLVQYDWPGNIRQLQNVVEQLVALSPSPLISATQVRQSLPDSQTEALIPLSAAKRQFEHDYVSRLLRATRGNVSRAARLAGRNRSDFHKIIRRHEIDVGRFKHTQERNPGAPAD